MGAAFSLVSLLVSVAILLWLMAGSGYLSGVSTANKTARQQVNVLAGNDPTGTVKATDSIKTHVDRSSAVPKLIVDTVSPGGPMDVKYGIRPGDQIVQLSGLDFAQNLGGDYEGAVAWIHDSYARGGTIVVRRDGQELTLPTPEHVAMIAQQSQAAQQLAQQQAAIMQAAPPTPPVQPKASELSGIQNMLDSIRSAPK